MEKKYLKRAIGIISLLLVTAVYVHIMQLLVTDEGGIESLNLKGFYLEDKDSLDVVVMGSSEVMNGFAASEVYRESGYTSYPYAFALNPVSLWKYELKDIERTQHPQVLVVEVNGALYLEDEYIHSEDCQRLLAEMMPLSADLLRFAAEKSEHPMESLFPFIKYHYKWDQSFEQPAKDRLMMYRDGHSRLRGAMTPLYRDRFEFEGDFVADDTTADLNQDGEAELRAFLEECKKSDIPTIVFVEFPHILNRDKAYQRHQRTNRAAEIIREEGFDFIDFTKEENVIGLDPRTDFFDTHHMAAPGQKKFSAYLAKTIKERYGLTPKEQTEESRKEWKDTLSLADKFYGYFDSYTTEHSSEPYKVVDHDLLNDCRTIGTLEKQ